MDPNLLQPMLNKTSASCGDFTFVNIYILVFWGVTPCVYEVRHKKKEINLIARESRMGGERQTDDYRTCSDLSQCYKAQLYRFTQYKWTHLQI